MAGRIILAVRILAVPAMIVGILALLDVALPASIVDEAVVKSKEVIHSRGTSYNIHAQGRFSYSESVSRTFYAATQNGMKLRLYLTTIFKEWKKAELLKEEHVDITGCGQDMYWMPFLGLVLLLPCLCYRNADKWFNVGNLIVFAVAEFAGNLLFARLALVWLGFFDKM